MVSRTVQSSRQFAGERGPLAGLDWRALRSAYRVFLNNPTQGIHHIQSAGRNSRWQAWVERRLARQATHLTGCTLEVDLQVLVQLPPDTLGGAYARHMLHYGFDPHTFRAGADQETWLQQRMAISHDIYHIIAGFDGSPIGEFGVAAFTFVQYWDLLNGFVLSFVPISLTNPLWTVKLLRALGRGFWAGIKSKPVIAYPIEDRWAVPLVQVRRELGIL